MGLPPHRLVPPVTMTPPNVASPCSMAAASNQLSLTDASRRLRRRPGRPRRKLGGAPIGSRVQGAASGPAKDAAETSDFAATLLPRGLPLPAAAAYSGVPVRALWRLIAGGLLAPVRVPGTRRVLLLRDDLDRLLEASTIRSAEAAWEHS